MYLNLEDRLGLLFSGGIFLVSIPSGLYATVYRATGMFARGTMLGNLTRGAGRPWLPLLLPAARFVFRVLFR